MDARFGGVLWDRGPTRHSRRYGEEARGLTGPRQIAEARRLNLFGALVRLDGRAAPVDSGGLWKRPSFNVLQPERGAVPIMHHASRGRAPIASLCSQRCTPVCSER